MFRRLVLIALLALVAGVLGYTVTRRMMPAAPAAPSAEDKLVWLAREFELGPAQTAEIDRLQVAYEPICAAHCEAIIDAQSGLSAAATPTERAAAEAELEKLKRVCADATRAHLRAVAAVMAPEQGARFLEMMEPRVAHAPDQTGAPSLDAAP